MTGDDRPIIDWRDWRPFTLGDPLTGEAIPTDEFRVRVRMPSGEVKRVGDFTAEDFAALERARQGD